MSNEPFHPLIASLAEHIVYPEDAREAYLSRDTMLRMRAEIATRQPSEPTLCVHLVYAFIRCHERGLKTLGKQLLQLAKVGLGQDAIEDVILARRTGQEPETRAIVLPKPQTNAVSVQRVS